MANTYDPYYAQNLEQATAKKAFIQEDVDTQERHKRNMQEVSSQYAAENDIPLAQASQLMQARWDNQQQQKAFDVAEETRALNEKNRFLNDSVKLNAMKSEINALNHNNIRSSKQIQDITARYSDVLNSPHEQVNQEAKSNLQNAWAVNSDAQKYWFTQAEADGVPVKEFGGLPEETLDENGMYSSKKGKSFAMKHHDEKVKEILALKKAESDITEQAREDYLDAREEAKAEELKTGIRVSPERLLAIRQKNALERDRAKEANKPKVGMEMFLPPKTPSPAAPIQPTTNEATPQVKTKKVFDPKTGGVVEVPIQ